MGGSPNTVTTNQSQKYTPNQPILGMGQQAGQMATTAAQAPFQMPVAPIAGFNPFQQQGFGETAAAQGMAQPYFGAGANYLQQSAQGPSEGDIAQFYNPMASNVTAQMQNIFGQQMRQTTGQATQQAGGVGADRIGVAQSNLANQQGLAAGQTYAGLYNQALQAAEQQKQMEAGAGYGLGQMGPAAQNAQLQGIQALLGAGGQQQQLAQAQLNAPYQNTLAQIAYPFQTAQYLAGITGGLAPAMGGQTQGQATTTYPQPSMLSQILGGATAGAGILGGLGQTGMFGGSPSYGGGSAFTGDAYGGSASNPLSGLTAADYGPTGFFGARGGNVDKFADGGMTGMMPHPAYKTGLLPSPESRPGSIAPPTSMPPWMQQGPSGMPFGGGMPQRGFADGGGTDYGMLAKRSEMQELGNLLPSAEAGNPLASTVLHDVGGSLPMQGGGDIPSPTFPGSSPPPIGGPTPIPSMQLQPGGGKSGPYGQFMMMQSPSMGSQSQSGGVGQAIGMAEKVLPMLAMMREGGIVNPFAAGEGYADGGSEDTDINAYNDQSQPMWKRVGLQSDPDAMPPEITAGKSQVDPNSPTLVGGPSHVGFADESPTGGFQGRPQPPTPFGGGPRPYAMSPSQAPYPDALQRDWGQNATRSPWMALVKAGAQMMQTRGPIGSVIGAGLGAGAGELESQRKELRSEEDINQKAEHLAQQAQFHLDEYTKTKPHEAAEERLHEEQLAQQRQFHNVPVGYRQTKEGLEPIPGGPADPETVGSLAMAKMQGGLMNDDALNLAVDRIHSGDPSALQNLGRGAQTGINLTRIQNRLAERAKAEGWTGADLAAARASFTSQAAAARVAATREANVEASVEEAKNTFPLALKASMAVPRTNFVPLNKLTQAVAAGTASPEQRAFVVANRGAITAYAQAMSRIGVTSVHAQQAAEDLLLTADGHDAYAAGIHQMEQEMDAAKIAPEIVRQHILARISGKGAPAPTTMEGAAAQRGQQPATPAPQTGAPAGIPQGSVHGTKAGKPGWRTPDGQFIVD